METANVGLSEEVSEEERKLAESLRLLCTQWGTEQESTLSRSAAILLDLGRLYTRYTKQRSGMLQKITFVKAAALISGARTRYEKMGMEDKIDSAQMCFRHMATSLLSCCCAAQRKDLVLISDKTSAYLQKVREAEKNFIKDNLRILDVTAVAKQHQLRQKQRERIESLKHLLKCNTEHYMGMMQRISEECVAILGKPPCKYALVGLGSLAREEVTLYSDFEHVIVLDDGVAGSVDIEKIREYFRWYSVLFHVIIIGIGETFIPTVGVKSLNDLYSSDKTKDWFFDLHTPGGVSFDGRFPHSCKTPLGKQEPSSYRKHVVELIQPVSKMIAFLSTDEDVKNGYHLRDVLIRTRFVHGDEEVFEEFQRKSLASISAGSRDIDVLEQSKIFVATMDYTLRHIADGQRVGLPDMQVFYNFKQVFYRPMSILIASMCRIFHKFTGSNFEFFQLFRELHPSVDLHDLEYSLAVACEVRLKLYSALEHQRQKAAPTYLRNFIGGSCLVGTYRTLLAAGIVFRRVIKREIGFDRIAEYLDLIGYVSAKLIDFDAEIFNLLGFGKLPDHDKMGMESISFYLQEAHNDQSNQESYFKVIEEILDRNGQTGIHSQEYCKVMSILCFRRSKHKEGLKLMEIWTKKYLEGNRDEAADQRYIQMQHMKSVSSVKCLPPQQAVEYAMKELAEKQDVTTQIFFRVSAFCGKMLMGYVDDARKLLREASKICASRETAKVMIPDLHLSAAKIIFDLQMRNAWPEDAYLMLDLLQMLRSTVRQDKSFSTASTHSRITNKVSTAELATKWAEMTFVPGNNPDDDIRERILVLLLRKRGILKFPEISRYFSEAPKEVLKNHTFFFGLNHSIMVICKYIADVPDIQLGEDMMSVFRTFPEHFKSPFFLGTLRCLTIHVAKISINLKHHVEAVPTILFRAGKGEMTILYNLAVKHLTHLNFERCASFLWKIINSKKGCSVLKNESCRLLVHVTIPAPLVGLLHYLTQHRASFVERHSFPATDDKRSLFNEAVSNYARFYFRPSALSFWRVICSSRFGSRLRHRAIEMLMFVVLDIWKCDGYPMLTGAKYVFNQWTRSPNSNHAEYEYEDLRPALLMGADDTLTALRTANVSGDA